MKWRDWLQRMEAWEGRKAQERLLEAAQLSKTSWYLEQHQYAVLDKQTLTVLPWCVCSFTSQSINKSNLTTEKK